MKKVDKVLWYHQEDLRKDIIKALFGEYAILHEDYIDFHYDDDNRAGLFVKVQDKDQPNLTKTFRIMIDEVEEALKNYMEERKRIVPVEGHEDAFFLSIQRKRMGVRSVEKLVKKYAGLVTNLKKITPH